MKKFFVLSCLFLFSNVLFSSDNQCGDMVPRQCSSGKWGYFKLIYPTFFCSNGVNTSEVQKTVESFGIKNKQNGDILLNILRDEVKNTPSFKYAKDIINIMSYCHPASTFNSDTAELVFSHALKIVQILSCQYEHASNFTSWTDHDGKNQCSATVELVANEKKLHIDLEAEIDMKGNYIIEPYLRKTTGSYYDSELIFP